MAVNMLCIMLCCEVQLKGENCKYKTLKKSNFKARTAGKNGDEEPSEDPCQ
jgi:hypothetical protein